MELRRRLMVALVVLLALCVLATLGYLALAPQATLLQAIYVVVSTIAGVSNGEEILDTSHHPELRIFNIFVIILGWGIAAYVLASITTFLVGGELNNIFWRRKMQKRISELRHHYIVCGLGDTGRHAAEELMKTATPYVVVESHEDTLRRLRDHESGFYKDLLCIIGDATDDLVLEEAGIGHAKGLIAALANDKDNLVITVMVRQRNPHIRIVARCTDPKFADKLTKAGANSTVSPNMIGGMRLASEVLRPHVVGFLDSMLKQQSQTVRVEEIELAEGSPWIGKEFGALNLRHNYNVLAMAIRDSVSGKAGNYTINPPDHYPLVAGSVLIVIGEVQAIHRARQHALHPGLHMMGAHQG